MIVFDLECGNGHIFEGWFDDREDMKKQQEKGILTCPVCETTEVVQKLHAVSIRRSSSSPAPVSEKALQANQEAMAALVEKVAEYVQRNFENAGADFARQALKMHYGVEAYRSIRGTTTAEEDRILEKEGVPIMRVPVIKKPGDDLN